MGWRSVQLVLEFGVRWARLGRRPPSGLRSDEAPIVDLGRYRRDLLATHGNGRRSLRAPAVSWLKWRHPYIAMAGTGWFADFLWTLCGPEEINYEHPVSSRTVNTSSTRAARVADRITNRRTESRRLPLRPSVDEGP